MKVLDQFKQNMESEQQAAADAYKALVSKLASSDRKVSDKVTKEQIRDALVNAGKTVPDLERDVAKEKRCNECRELVKGYSAAVNRYERVDRELAENNLARQKAWAEFHTKGQRLSLEKNQARVAVSAIQSAARELEQLTGEVVVLSPADDAAE